MQPVRAGGSPLTAALSAGEAFGAIARSCIEHYEANRTGVLAGKDPEFLHQARVALRRLRTALDLFKPLFDERDWRRGRNQLRSLLRRLGPAREWDVFLAFTLAPAAAAAPADRGLAAMVRECESRRRVGAAGARRAAGAHPPSRIEDALRELRLRRGPAGRPARRHARTMLERCARRVRRRGKGVATLGAEDLHRLRLAVKRLRYALHYFAPLFRKRRIAAVREALENLQRVLGSANDCVVAAALLRKLGVEPGAAIARRNAAKLAAHRRELRLVWKAYRSAERGWE